MERLSAARPPSTPGATLSFTEPLSFVTEYFFNKFFETMKNVNLWINDFQFSIWQNSLPSQQMTHLLKLLTEEQKHYPSYSAAFLMAVWPCLTKQWNDSSHLNRCIWTWTLFNSMQFSKSDNSKAFCPLTKESNSKYFFFQQGRTLYLKWTNYRKYQNSLIFF